jgi:hypothetical protein
MHQLDFIRFDDKDYASKQRNKQEACRKGSLERRWETSSLDFGWTPASVGGLCFSQCLPSFSKRRSLCFPGSTNQLDINNDFEADCLPSIAMLIDATNVLRDSS